MGVLAHVERAVDALGIKPREIRWQAAAGLGTAPPIDADAVRMWRELSDRIRENQMQKVNTAIFVDEAGDASHDVLLQLLRLVRLGNETEARLTIVLAADPPQAHHWADVIRDAVDLRIDLGPWRQVDTIGFVPGFAYLTGLDEGLQLPRRATPRARVPAGSLAIADAFTAVYPFDSAGGWHLIGRVVDVRMFDERGPLLELGDRVRFVS